MEPREFLGHLDPFPLVQDVVLPNIDAAISNEIIHNVHYPNIEVNYNAPLLSFGCGDMPYEFESSYTSGFQYFQPCLDQEEDFSSINDYSPIDDETIVDDIMDLEVSSCSGYW